MHVGPSDANYRRARIATIGYTLIALGLSLTLFAVALVAWPHLRELELISACIGLMTSIIAAVILTTDTR